MPSSIPAIPTSGSRALAPPPDLLLINWPLKDQPIPASFTLALAAGAAWLAERIRSYGSAAVPALGDASDGGYN